MKRPRLNDYKYNSGQGEIAIVLPYLRDMEKYIDHLLGDNKNKPITPFSRINEVGISVRLYNCLKSYLPVTTYSEMNNIRMNELIKLLPVHKVTSIRNAGNVMQREYKELMKSAGLI